MKGGRVVMLVETALLVTAVVCLHSLHERAKAETAAKDLQLAALQKEHRELLLKYNDVSTMYAELQAEMNAAAADREAALASLNKDMPTDVGELQRALEYERKQYAELEDAFESLAARVDMYEQNTQVAENRQAEGDDVFGRGPRRASPEMRQRMNTFLDDRLSALQRRIDSETDPRIQENLAEIGNSIQTLRELRDQMRNAVSDEERQQLRDQMREEGRRMGELAQQNRRLEVESLAESFNIPKDRVDEFVQSVNDLGSATGMFGGMMRGGMRGGGRRGR